MNRCTLVFFSLFLLALNSKSHGGEGGGLKPGEAHYPTVNPNAHQDVSVSLTIPEGWDIQISAHYKVSDKAAAATSLIAPNCFKGGGLVPYQVGYWLDLPVPVARDGGRYTATVPMDHFLPDKCGWQINAFGYRIFKNGVAVAADTLTTVDAMTKHGVAFADGGLALIKWNLDAGDGEISRGDPNIWCWASDTDNTYFMGGYKLHCDSGDRVKKSLIQYINPQLRGDWRYTQIRDRSVSFILHDLDAETAAIRAKMEAASPGH